MRKLFFAALIAAASGANAQAEPRHILHGLFCNTEAQIDQSLAHLSLNLAPQSVVELMNEEKVACVLADKVQYMVIRPIIIGGKNRSSSLLKYQATLIGVLVGKNIRRVEPPVQIFFVTTERLIGAVVLSGA
jgi:hypothetical protein